MKDQTHGQTNQSHDKNHDNQYQKRDDHKTSHPGLPTQKDHSANHPDSHSSTSNQKQGLGKDPFHDVDHQKMNDFSKRLENDEGLRNKYEQDPHSVLEEEGINLPRGMRASYDNQYLKDENNQYRYGKRFGHINLSHQ